MGRRKLGQGKSVVRFAEVEQSIGTGLPSVKGCEICCGQGRGKAKRQRGPGGWFGQLCLEQSTMTGTPWDWSDLGLGEGEGVEEG